MIYFLRAGLLSMVGLLPLTLCAQQLNATDTAEIQQKALRHVRQFEGLLNVISQSDDYFRKYSFDQLIRNYYSEESSYQIFRDSLVVIEDDLNPKNTSQDYGNLLTIKDYLKAFFSLYEKSPPPSVVFSNYEVSSIKQDEFLYVEVLYDSKFRNKHRAYPDLDYPVRHKRATIKAEPQATGWSVTITDIGYARPGDQRPSSVAVSDSTAVAEPSVRPPIQEEIASVPPVDGPEPTDSLGEATGVNNNAFKSMRRVYRKGKTYPLPVRINYSTPPTSLALYLGTEQVRDISSNLADSTLSWQVPSELPAGDNYQLHLYDPVSEEIVKSSTFAVKNRPRWPWVVGGVGAAAIIYAIVSSSNNEGGGTPGGDDELPPPPSPE